MVQTARLANERTSQGHLLVLGSVDEPLGEEDWVWTRNTIEPQGVWASGGAYEHKGTAGYKRW